MVEALNNEHIFIFTLLPSRIPIFCNHWHFLYDRRYFPKFQHFQTVGICKYLSAILFMPTVLNRRRIYPYADMGKGNNFLAFDKSQS